MASNRTFPRPDIRRMISIPQTTCHLLESPIVGVRPKTRSPPSVRCPPRSGSLVMYRSSSISATIRHDPRVRGQPIAVGTTLSLKTSSNHQLAGHRLRLHIYCLVKQPMRAMAVELAAEVLGAHSSIARPELRMRNSLNVLIAVTTARGTCHRYPLEVVKCQRRG
jgi:hypothetical protein